MINLDGKVAVVTGGSSGIGLAAVTQFLQAGARVAFCGRDADRLHAAEQHLVDRFPAERIFTMPADVLSADAMTAFASAVDERFGAADMLVNNAGQGSVSTFANTDDAAWHYELELKLFSGIRRMRPSIRQREAGDAGAMVCVSSRLALQVEPHMVCTSAARGSLLNLTRALATEFAPKGTRVNSILVGLV